MSAARTDPDAFRELYGRYAERVHGYFVRRTRDDAAALDLTAETFAQAWLVRARFRDEAGGSAALALLHTHPTCTTVTAGVEYDCTLRSTPSTQGAPMPGQWLGTVEPTVDTTKHVNGGCRSLNTAGTHWRCYIGSEAVRQQIIGAGFLGSYAPSPGVG